MGGGCVRTGLRSEAIRLRRSLSVLPGRCGVAAPVCAGFAGQTDGKSPAGINFQPGFSCLVHVAAGENHGAAFPGQGQGSVIAQTGVCTGDDGKVPVLRCGGLYGPAHGGSGDSNVGSGSRRPKVTENHNRRVALGMHFRQNKKGRRSSNAFLTRRPTPFREAIHLCYLSPED